MFVTKLVEGKGYFCSKISSKKKKEKVKDGFLWACKEFLQYHLSAGVTYTSFFWVNSPEHVSASWLHLALWLLNKVSSRAASSERWRNELRWAYDLVLLQTFLTFLTKNYKFALKEVLWLLLSSCSFPMWIYNVAIVELSRLLVLLIIGLIMTEQCRKSSRSGLQCSAL